AKACAVLQGAVMAEGGGVVEQRSSPIIAMVNSEQVRFGSDQAAVHPLLNARRVQRSVPEAEFIELSEKSVCADVPEGKGIGRYDGPGEALPQTRSPKDAIDVELAAGAID